MCTSRAQRGLTLIELIIFVVIVSVALAGVLTVLNLTVKNSADPLIRKQMLAIAEALMEEVQSLPFTWCDPDDPASATATAAADCAVAEGLGTETVSGNTDTRPSNTYPFDNVSDYHNLAATTNISGTAMPAGYSASVSISEAGLNGIATTEALRIAITVSRGSESLVLEGYRTRYSPTTLP